MEDATSGAPEGGVPARHEGAFYEVPDLRSSAISALRSLTHVRGKGKEGGPRALQNTGAMNHVCLNVLFDK